MDLPLQITFRHMEPSAAMAARIRKHAQQLKRFSPHITHCWVTVESPPKHQRQGNLFNIRIDITAPGTEISIDRSPSVNHAHEDPYIALRDAFRAARRKLQDYVRGIALA